MPRRDLGTGPELRDDQESFRGLEDLFDVSDVVARKHDEPVRVGPNVLVLFDRQRKRLATARIQAFTDEGREGGRGGQVLDALVHVTKDALVLRGTLPPNFEFCGLAHALLRPTGVQTSRGETSRTPPWRESARRWSTGGSSLGAPNPTPK